MRRQRGSLRHNGNARRQLGRGPILGHPRFILCFIIKYSILRYDLYDRQGFFIQDPRPSRSKTEGQQLDTRTSAGISYRFLAGSALQEVDTNLVLRLTDVAGFLYSSRYDVVADRFLDNFVGIRLISTCDCWAVDFAVVDRTNPHEVEVRAQLTLVGFGSSRSETRSAVAP